MSESLISTKVRFERADQAFLKAIKCYSQGVDFLTSKNARSFVNNFATRFFKHNLPFDIQVKRVKNSDLFDLNIIPAINLHDSKFNELVSELRRISREGIDVRNKRDQGSPSTEFSFLKNVRNINLLKNPEFAPNPEQLDTTFSDKAYRSINPLERLKADIQKSILKEGIEGVEVKDIAKIIVSDANTDKSKPPVETTIIIVSIENSSSQNNKKLELWKKYYEKQDKELPVNIFFRKHEEYQEANQFLEEHKEIIDGPLIKKGNISKLKRLIRAHFGWDDSKLKISKSEQDIKEKSPSRPLWKGWIAIDPPDVERLEDLVKAELREDGKIEVSVAYCLPKKELLDQKQIMEHARNVYEQIFLGNGTLIASLLGDFVEKFHACFIKGREQKAVVVTTVFERDSDGELVESTIEKPKVTIDIISEFKQINLKKVDEIIKELQTTEIEMEENDSPKLEQYRAESSMLSSGLELLETVVKSMRNKKLVLNPKSLNTADILKSILQFSKLQLNKVLLEKGIPVLTKEVHTQKLTLNEVCSLFSSSSQTLTMEDSLSDELKVSRLLKVLKRDDLKGLNKRNPTSSLIETLYIALKKDTFDKDISHELISDSTHKKDEEFGIKSTTSYKSRTLLGLVNLMFCYALEDRAGIPIENSLVEIYQKLTGTTFNDLSELNREMKRILNTASEKYESEVKLFKQLHEIIFYLEDEMNWLSFSSDKRNVLYPAKVLEKQGKHYLIEIGRSPDRLIKTNYDPQNKSGPYAEANKHFATFPSKGKLLLRANDEVAEGDLINVRCVGYRYSSSNKGFYFVLS